MSLDIGRQRRYDLLLAIVPVVLFGAFVAWWAFDVPSALSVAASAVVAGVVLLVGIASYPPNDSGER